MTPRLLFVTFLIFSQPFAVLGQPRTAGQNKSPKSFVQGPAQVDPKLPNVLIIGDSISIGYTQPARKLLAGKANVFRIAENGGPTSNGLKKLDKWLGAKHWDVIHFNWGLHDLKMDAKGNHQVALAQYEKNLTQLVAMLKKQGTKLIWASTTPVPMAKVSPPRKNADVVAYNKAAKKIMEKNGIALNDLYAHALPRLEKIQRPANVHFTEGGSLELARQVAASVEKALATTNNKK